MNTNFEILAFNKAWSDHVSRSYGKTLVKGKKMTEFIRPEHLGDFYRDYLKALKGEAIFEERKLKNCESEAWYIVKFEPAFNSQKEIIGVAINTVDITSKVQSQQTVLAQRASLNTIAYMQSHELRKPVASILGLIEVLKMEKAEPDSEAWQLLIAAANDLDDVIKKIVMQTSDNED